MLSVYDSARRPPAIVEELIQIVRYRSLVRQLVRRDIVTRYKRSVLGLAWTMLNPLGIMLVLLLAFSKVFGAGQSYAVYLLTGLVAWNFFSQTTTFVATQFVWGGVLLSRIYVPRAAFAVSAIGAGLVNLVLSLVPLAVVMAVTGTRLHTPVVLLPVAIGLLALFAFGVGLLLSTLAVYFSDVVEMYQVAVLAWLYLTPIIYPEQIVPASYRWWMFHLNPMYHFIKLTRLALLYGQWPSVRAVGAAAAIAVGAAALGWVVFTSRADDLAYRV